jgi:hypothetical protein
MAERYRGLTDAQEALLVALSDQRCANLLATADFVADLSPEAKEFLREAKPKTLTFLKDAREAEIAELENGIELVRSFKTAGRVVRWTVVTLFGAFIGLTLIWDKISGWVKSK